MQNNYPDPADRILAYGEQLGEDDNNIQSAISNRNNPQPDVVSAPEPVQQAQPLQRQVSQQMLSSLQAAGVSSEKFMESYAHVALTTQRQFEVSSKVGAKAGW